MSIRLSSVTLAANDSVSLSSAIAANISLSFNVLNDLVGVNVAAFMVFLRENSWMSRDRPFAGAFADRAVPLLSISRALDLVGV